MTTSRKVFAHQEVSELPILSFVMSWFVYLVVHFVSVSCSLDLSLSCFFFTVWGGGRGEGGVVIIYFCMCCLTLNEWVNYGTNVK